MRTELSRTASQHLCVPIHAMRWHRQFVWLGRKRPALPGHAKLALHFLVVGSEVFIANRPISAHAFSRIGPEIHRVKSRRDPKPHKRAASHTDTSLWNDGILTRVNAWFGPHDLRRVCLRVLQVGGWIDSFPCFKHDH
jgi:hypothetical protein